MIGVLSRSIVKVLSGYPPLIELYYRKRNDLFTWQEDRSKRYELEYKLNTMMSYREFPFFHNIQIETVNRCNFTCSFCPVNKLADIRKYAKMEERLFVEIVRQLNRLNYSGSLGLFSNNEPLLDERLPYFAEIAKTALPNSHVYIYTNGSLLTIDIFCQLIKWLDRIVIDNYSDRGILLKTVRDISDCINKEPILQGKVSIVMRKKNEILTTRGGLSPNKRPSYIPKSPCVLPFDQMVIRPDGKVSLCCNDAYGQMTLGDTNKESLSDIWRNDVYGDVRRKILISRKLIDLCSKCDSMHPFAKQF